MEVYGVAIVSGEGVALLELSWLYLQADYEDTYGMKVLGDTAKL